MRLSLLEDPCTEALVACNQDEAFGVREFKHDRIVESGRDVCDAAGVVALFPKPACYHRTAAFINQELHHAGAATNRQETSSMHRDANSRQARTSSGCR